MRFRTTLNKEEQQFVIEKWHQGVSKAEIGRQLIKKFDLLDTGMGVTANGARKRVEGLIKQYEAHQHRPNAYNEFIDDQEMMPDGFTHGWIKRKLEDGTSVSAFVRNPEIENELENLQEEIIESMKSYAPKYPKLKRKKCKDGHLLVVSLTDLHVGKLCTEFATGNDYDTDIAIARAKEGVEGLLQRASGFNIDKILFIGGHDVLHIDNPKRTTTSGTPQDTSGMRYDNFMKAKRLYIELIEMMLSVADVEFFYCPSNHDYTNVFFLCQTVEAWFNNNKNITFHVDLMHRKYHLYGNSLIGLSHGDGAKEDNLGMLMSVEASDIWHKAKHRYFYLGHLHHRIAKEYPNVTIEYTRSPSGTDRRHSDNGYISSKAIEAYIHSRDQGQVAKFTYIF